MTNETGLIMTAALIAIISAVGLVQHYRSRRAARQTAIDKWAVAPTSIFLYFPGRGQGYAGYTDYAAMGYEVNDSLLWQSPEMQFDLVGFASGFLEGLRLHDIHTHQQILTFGLTSADQYALGWLRLMQRRGIDNAGQSSKNLTSIITSVARELHVNGPLRLPFWGKFDSAKFGNPRKESLRRSRTSTKAHQQFLARYELRRSEGIRLAQSASSRPSQIRH